jgi:hypothetical protein
MRTRSTYVAACKVSTPQRDTAFMTAARPLLRLAEAAPMLHLVSACLTPARGRALLAGAWLALRGSKGHRRRSRCEHLPACPYSSAYFKQPQQSQHASCHAHMRTAHSSPACSRVQPAQLGLT